MVAFKRCPFPILVVGVLIIVFYAIIPAMAVDLFILPTSEGGRIFTAPGTGIYRFLITGGAYENCPVTSEPDHPELWGWQTQTIIYKNRPIQWGPVSPECLNFACPTSWDFEVGDWHLQPTYELAEQIGLGKSVDIPLKTGEFVNLYVHDCHTCYWDNFGGVYINVKQYPNHHPVANAGPDQTVSVGSSVILDGSGSYDPEEWKAITYQWTMISKPSGSKADLSNPAVVNPIFTPDKPGDYIFQLIVIDSLEAQSLPDSVTIHVQKVCTVKITGDTSIPAFFKGDKPILTLKAKPSKKGGEYNWEITNGGLMVDIIGTTHQQTLQMQGAFPSYDKAIVKVTYTLPSGESCADNYGITVRSPAHLMESNYKITRNGIYGYSSIYTFQVLDQFNQPLEYIMPIDEIVLNYYTNDPDLTLPNMGGDQTTKRGSFKDYLSIPSLLPLKHDLLVLNRQTIVVAGLSMPTRCQVYHWYYAESVEGDCTNIPIP